MKSIRNNQYLYFLLKLLALFCLVFCLDFLFGAILRYLYFNQDSGPQYHTTYAIETTKADLLVFGSSRANHHYHPDVFDEYLNLSYYNAGRDGNFIFYHDAVLKSILKRYSPKVVILDFVEYEFRKKEGTYDRLASLLPYYKTHPEMRPTIELKSSCEKIKLISHIYPYNSLVLSLAVEKLGSGKKEKTDDRGYMPLHEKWTFPARPDTSSLSYITDSIKIKAYESFIQSCLESNIKLYIVCSPYFGLRDHPDYSLTIARDIAKKYNIIFFDFSQDSLFINSPDLFTDPEHMNDDGAILFSRKFMDRLILSPDFNPEFLKPRS